MDLQTYAGCFDLCPTAFCLVQVTGDVASPHCRFLYVNAAFCALEGKIQEELLGRDVGEAFGEAGPRCLELCRRVVCDGGDETAIVSDEAGVKRRSVYCYRIDGEQCGLLVSDAAGANDVKRVPPASVDIFGGGFSLLRLRDDGFRAEFASDGFCRMLEIDRDALLGRSATTFFEDVHPDDRERVENVYRANARDGARFSCIFRVRFRRRHLVWLNANANVRGEGEDFLYYISYSDVTTQKDAEQNLIERERTYVLATENTDVNLCQLDPRTGVVTFTEKYCKAHGLDVDRLERFPEGLFEKNLVREDSIVVFSDFIEALRAGKMKASVDVWLRRPNGDGWWCERLSAAALSDEEGRPARVVICGNDVTAAKAVERKYREELAYQSGLREDALLEKIRVNLSRDAVEGYAADASVALDLEGLSFAESVNILLHAVFTEEQQHRLSARLQRDILLRDFSAGDTSRDFVYQRITRDGGVLWVDSRLRLYRHPDSGDILCFAYTEDVDDEQTLQLALHRLIDLDYEYIAVIDAQNDVIRLLGQNQENAYSFSDPGGSYSRQSWDIIADMVAEEEVEECRRQLSLESIVEGLNRDDVYSRTYAVRNAGGGFDYKRWKYAWLDDGKRSVLCTRIDVTDIYEAERQQKELLRHALARAEQANVAKTEFLSHISHEIRTPMNTIIGMTALAAQAVNDPVQVADSLTKVGLSARFLLSLINDILDMTRIESGKVNIKQEKIPFEEFINGINAVCYAQAAAKGVDYDAVLTSFTEDYYIGDAMKLQQVLINIIANAVKFTPRGGKVQFMAHQEKVSRDTALMKFTVNDTGVGIREEFLPHIFEPFEQDQRGSASIYGGTGLGLTICKNLVELMGGSISVNSIVGIGTEFIVSVRLGIAEESRPRRKVEVPFANLSALVVDDEIIVCRHTEQILADMGLKAAWATSGPEAIRLVRRKWDDDEHYDIILIDWKMPGMDGIETARRIRDIVGPDVTIIIITAYDWASIETEARQAGVNMLIAKPLFKSSLCSTFQKIYAEKERQAPPEPLRTDYNFSGRHALLVEDHVFNVEIVRHLLEDRHMEVDVAENGLVALERFAEKPDGHYDVILMDIRMPVMDGLSAARSIRQMTKAYAKTIPIIAMSANAFDEDMDKSKAAGMDAHLVKPLEPLLLCQTLEDYLEREIGVAGKNRLGGTKLSEE